MSTATTTSSNVVGGESAMIAQFLSQLAQLPLVYPDHHLAHKPAVRPPNVKKPLAFNASLAAPAAMTLHLKVMKTNATATLSDISPDTPVRDLKRAVLAALGVSHRTHAARVLVKGKVLADDQKYVREYPAVADGVALTVMLSELSPEDAAAVVAAEEAEAAAKQGAGEETVAKEVKTGDEEVEKKETDTSLAGLAKDPAFWTDIRAAVDAHAAKRGLAGGDAVNVLNLFKRALAAEADKRSSA
ncbi:hypothetical protein H9P43_006673 [Blastocladiella emersonii ATCC 22665]|nr:hypothetical protein H9P43_006673 [Blastocladiella emersonii ATCC 22665]